MGKEEKMKKRIFAFAVAAALIISMVPLAVFAESLPSPIALYEFSDDANPGKDTSGNGYDLEANWPGVTIGNGMCTLANDWAGFHYKAGGADDSDFTDACTSYTIVTRVTINDDIPTDDGDPGHMDVVSNGWGQGFSLVLRHNGIIFYAGEWLWVDMGENYYKGTHTYAITYDEVSKTIKGYFDGKVKVEKVLESYVAAQTNCTFCIGCLGNVGGFMGYSAYPCHPCYDYVVFYGEALSKDQIKAVDDAYAQKPSAASNSPIAAYNFNDAENLGKDISGNGNDLTPWYWGDGQVRADNGKVKLDGKAVLQARPDASGKDFTDSLESFTMTVKASVQNASDNAVLISSGFDWSDFGGGIALVVCGDNAWFAIDVRSDTNWRSINLNQLIGEGWSLEEHRYTVVYDDTAKTMKLYVDETMVYSAQNVSGINMDSDNTIFAVGCLNKYIEGSENWCGYTSEMTVDDVAVFDYALSYSEILGIDSVFADETVVPANLTVSYSDTASDPTAGASIDHLYINATVSADETRDVGIIFSDSADSCKFAKDGGNPLFSRVCTKYDALIQSGCYGNTVITAENFGGEEGDKIIAVYWQDLPIPSGGQLYVCTFAKESDGSISYGEVVPFSLSDGTNVLPLEAS